MIRPTVARVDLTAIKANFRQISDYLARSLFFTSDMALPADRKKRMVATFCANTELCKITEDLIFTEPYMVHPRNRWTAPQLDSIAAEFRGDAPLKLAISRLKLQFLNSDEVSHNIHIYPNKNDAFNKTVAPGSKEEVVLAKGDKIQVKCDIHTWMSAWIYVTDTPYSALSDADGSFSIGGLKPGKYKVELWHEMLGKQKAELSTSRPFSL